MAAILKKDLEILLTNNRIICFETNVWNQISIQKENGYCTCMLCIEMISSTEMVEVNSKSP